jgi:class 3 adenylate cyclase/tetratricopeptide (TPR) repeat protein
VERLRILFLAADPGSMGQVNAGREAREIRERLRTAAHRDAIELVERFAVRPGDLQRTFFEVRPHVVHFSGHGTAGEELVLEGDDGSAEPLGKRALTELFRVHKDTIRVVVLSACHSRPQVEAISEHVECAIGMRRAIGARAATEFSAAFYLAVGFGASVAMAFESAVAELRARGIPEDRTPQLVVRPGTDAKRVILLGSSPVAPEGDELPGALAEGPLPGPARIAAATGEHRVCTVMFVDLAGARRLVAHLDPEDAKDIVDRGFTAAREQVEALGGVFEDLPGSDRAMAVFGVPRAADDDAERAVLSALRVQLAVARVALPRPLRRSRLSARIGVSTGRVFAEPKSAARSQLTVLGEAVDTASTLQQAAPAGAVVIGRDTYRLVVSLFNLEPLAPVGSLPVYRVLCAIALRPVMALSDFYGVDTSLVGRAAELLRLTDALETMLEERRAGLITLVGASGIGRSRMLAGFFASLSLHREELLVMVAQGSPLLGTTSYGLAAAMLRRRFAILDSDEASVVRHKLRRGLRWLRMRSARRRPSRSPAAGLDRADIDDAIDQIAGILGAGTGDQARPGSMALEDGGGPQKQRIAAAAARLLRLASGSAPIVILCDDLQWADGASLDLLDDLLLRAEDLPVLAVCAARPELLERRPAWGEDKAAHTRVDLAPLARRHIEEMLRSFLRRVPDLSPSVVRTLADRAEGNPLILVETLHLLVDAGVIEVHGEAPWALREEKLGALALPATVQGIVQARLDRLEAGPRAVLAQAAVVGRTFWAGAVEQMQPADRQGVPATLPAGVLARLRDRQLIRPREPAMFPGEREYVFSESAMYEVAYETLSVKVRRPLHLVIARWLEARAAGGAGTALYALHYDRGGDPVRAAAAYVRAAGHAVSLGENAEARSLLERARDIDDEALANASVSGPLEECHGVMSWQDAAAVRLDLGDVLRRLGKLDEAERTLEEARARLPRRHDANDALRFDARIDHRLALVHRVRGALKEAIPLVERAIARALEAGAAPETPAMYALLAVLHRRERRLDASIEAALAGLRVSRAKGGSRDERWRGDVGQLLCGLGNALYARGRMVGAERSYQQALRAIDEAKQPHVAGLALNGIAAARLARGQLRGVRDMFARSLRLKERVGDLHQIAIACNNLAEVELRLGNVPAALTLARRSVHLGEQVSAGYDLADFCRNLSDASLASGDVEAALDAGRKALAIAETTGRVYLGDVAVSLARVCARAAEAAGSDALRARAVEVAEVLRRSLSVHFGDDELRRRADECRALLARVLLDTSSVLPASGGGG